MPTGYTYDVCEGKLTDFKQFAMRCSRAFGALVEMRDDAIDAKIPDEFQPSDYHKKAIKEAERELLTLRRMPDSGRHEFGVRKKAKLLADYAQYVKNDEENNARVEAMMSKVKAWKPPTSEHEGLKKFMLEQLEMSRQDSGYWQKEIKNLNTKSPDSFYDEALAAAKHNVAYHHEEYGKEVQRAKDRTEWVQSLRKSLSVN